MYKEGANIATHRRRLAIDFEGGYEGYEWTNSCDNNDFFYLFIISFYVMYSILFDVFYYIIFVL